MSNRIIKISNKEKFSENSENFQIEPSKKYGAVIKVRGNKGKPYSAYFVIVVLNKNNFEISRFIRWINDFSGREKVYLLKFTAPNESKFAVIGYRCNQETPLKSDLEIEIPDKNELDLFSFDESDNEIYDDLNDFTLPTVNLSSSDEEELEKKIIWITGSGRSGSTWLATQLLNHSDNMIWDEPYLGNHFLLVRLWKPVRGHLYFFSKAHRNIWLPLLRKLILNRTYSHTQTIDKNVIIKDPNAGGGMGIILECLPQSKLIFLLRDGRDVVDSQIDAFKKGSWNEDGSVWVKNRTRKQQIEFFSLQWSEWTEHVLESFHNHDQKNKILIRYEDLRKNTYEELKKIYNFIGIKTTKSELKEKIKKYNFKNIPASMKGSGKFYRVATPGKWKDNFNQKEKNLMNSIMGETLKKMKYDV